MLMAPRVAPIVLLAFASTLCACAATPDPGTDADALDAGDANAADARVDTGNDSGGGSCLDADADGDGHMAIVCGGDDCDDGDAERHPGHTEICDAADRDEDCDGTTFGARDGDGDGDVDSACCNGAGASRVCGDDCDDTLVGVHRDAPEVCNARDDDCDGATDEAVLSTFYPDVDHDGFGDGTMPTMACTLPLDHSTIGTDCDDHASTRHPGGVEACNAVSDEDCDASTHPFDMDDDHQDASTCGGTDCDDADANAYVGAPELCDRRDTDCSSGGGPVTAEDGDGDGHAPIGAACTGGYPADDCADSDPARHGGAIEVCDSFDADEDCDTSTTGAEDADGDGASGSCCNVDAVGARVCHGDDCEAAIASIHVGATETCNGIDDDCDWRIDETLTGCTATDPGIGSVQLIGCDCAGARPVCCRSMGGASVTCVNRTTACPAGSLRIACDGAEDCASGQACCTDGSGPMSCGAAGSCRYEVCSDHEDCPDGHACGSFSPLLCE
jgi:hypothetical protein